MKRSRQESTTRETLRIERLAAGGAGVARLATGAVVFVPRAAPGDLIEAEVRPGKPAHGRILRVIEPSPSRVEPACPHLVACGGCDFMHLAPRAQEEAHADIVKSALEHALAGAALPEIRVHPAPALTGYRTRARLFLSARHGRVRVGYRAAGSHEIAAIDACLVLDPTIAPLVSELGVVLAGARGDGDASVARGVGGKPVVSLSWRGEIAAATWAALDAKIASGAWAGARVELEGAGAPASFGDPRPVIEGADGAPLVMAAGGFAQASDTGAVLLARRADELSRLNPPQARHVVELFAGSGTLSVLLAAGAASFTSVEIDAAACAAARQNLAARDLRGARVVTADADAFTLPGNASVIVLDPPRAGAPGAARAIAASSARTVVYVACDPATLARDLAELTRRRLAITHVEIFELFPQTSHVETVVRLTRSR